MSRASEVGSPTNHPGSRRQQDTGRGILWSVHRWTKRNTYGRLLTSVRLISLPIYGLKGQRPVSRCGPEPRQFFRDPALLARDNRLWANSTHFKSKFYFGQILKSKPKLKYPALKSRLTCKSEFGLGFAHHTVIGKIFLLS